MEHIAAVLLIVGCFGDMSNCRELPAPTPIFETVEECDAELPVALRQLGDAGERVLATCVFVDPAMHEEDAELVWDIADDGSLQASIERANTAVASLPPASIHE